MNRKQRRDEAKKNKKAKQIIDENKEKDMGKSELYRLLKITIVVVIILIVLYLVVGIFISKEIKLFDKKDVDVEDTTVSNAILANATFEQKEEAYYVYFYDFDAEDTAIENVIITRLSGYTVYRVDTNDVLNQNYVVKEDSNKDAKGLEDMHVKEKTIIKVEGDSIVDYLEEEDIKAMS